MDCPGRVQDQLICIFNMAAMALVLHSPIVKLCIGNNRLILEGGDLHNCYANITSSCFSIRHIVFSVVVPHCCNFGSVPTQWPAIYLDGALLSL